MLCSQSLRSARHGESRAFGWSIRADLVVVIVEAAGRSRTPDPKVR
jgi:hypothetical protein